ncbi:hypothetical protein [Endozoicomonas arenosclerae]|uniref:hypothetical protein n=1 Tax=Endozoicomonas arenosclerae TaxID=1633495 RepID=UPI000780DB6C|nr:hypothetical protein [Endozoicomonas arenosclerae]
MSRPNNQLGFIVADLDRHVIPSAGLAELLYNCLADMEANRESSRLTLTELVYLADSLRAHCLETSVHMDALKSKLERKERNDR